MTDNRHRLMSIVAAAATLLAAGAAVADDDDRGRCDIRGSWLGGPPNSPGLLVTYDGKKKSGTKVQELVNIIDPTFGLIVPGNPCQLNNAVTLTSFRGLWERNRDNDDDDDEGAANTVRSTVIGYGLTPGPFPNGLVPACGVRITSVKTFSDDCDVLDIDFTFDFFEASDDILNDEPVVSADGTSQERRIEQ